MFQNIQSTHFTPVPLQNECYEKLILYGVGGTEWVEKWYLHYTKNCKSVFPSTENLPFA